MPLEANQGFPCALAQNAIGLADVVAVFIESDLDLPDFGGT